MMQVNGCGLTLMGLSRQDTANQCHATVWFTFLWLPILPLRRESIQFQPSSDSGFSYITLERTPLVFREVAKTYLFGWIALPLLVLGPLWGLSFAATQFDGLSDYRMAMVTVSIVWMAIAVWKIADWNENRLRPRH
jgi:hypothetical protein